MTSFFPQRLAVAIVTTLLAGCGVDLGEKLQSGQVLAWHGLQGRWNGPVVPAEPSCGPTTHGLMTIGSKGFGFDPFESTTIMDGAIDPNGHLSGKLVRQFGNQPAQSISFDATAQSNGGEDTISGTLQSARCQWKVTLHRG